VTDLLSVPPALVAEHVSVVPAVSALIVVEPQPVVDEIADSLSSTVQETVTLLTYHPLLPRVPDTFGVITGAVVSEGGGGGDVTVMLNLAGLRLYVPDPVVFVVMDTLTSPLTPDEFAEKSTYLNVSQPTKEVPLPPKLIEDGDAFTPVGVSIARVSVSPESKLHEPPVSPSFGTGWILKPTLAFESGSPATTETPLGWLVATSFWTLSASAAVAQTMTAAVASAVAFQNVRNMSLPPLRLVGHSELSWRGACGTSPSVGESGPPKGLVTHRLGTSQF
jgi:hypothetical protein